jgi:predicted RNase H-like HicB family nuclease
MRIAVTYDKNYNLKPLDEAEIIGIIDEEKKEVEQYENPGIGSKEATMDVILQLNAEAIIVKPQFLCPGSYYMSYGKLKYIPTTVNTLEEVLNNLEEIKKNLKEELDEELYAEKYPHY